VPDEPADALAVDFGMEELVVCRLEPAEMEREAARASAAYERAARAAGDRLQARPRPRRAIVPRGVAAGSPTPDPKRNFEVFVASLERAGFDVVSHSAPWSPDYIQTFAGGKAQLYLAGWLSDFPDTDNC
jgi:hypothetical protein